MQARVARDAQARAQRRADAQAPPTPAGARPPGTSAEQQIAEPQDWRKALRKIAGKPPDAARRPLREKDALNCHIQAYAKLGRGAAAALLTARGAAARLAGQGISARQSVPSALGGARRAPPAGVTASQVRPVMPPRCRTPCVFYRPIAVLIACHAVGPPAAILHAGPAAGPQEPPLWRRRTEQRSAAALHCAGRSLRVACALSGGHAKGQRAAARPLDTVRGRGRSA